MREHDVGPNRTIGVVAIEENLSPEAFHRWAQDFYKCSRDFDAREGFSPVPYFLLCRAIELELKSRQLDEMGQIQVKETFWHRLMQLYDALESDERVLSANEVSALRRADEIYAGKGFEYFDPVDAMRGYSNFPDLETLDDIARKLVGDPRRGSRFQESEEPPAEETPESLTTVGRVAAVAFVVAMLGWMCWVEMYEGRVPAGSWLFAVLATVGMGAFVWWLSGREPNDST